MVPHSHLPAWRFSWVDRLLRVARPAASRVCPSTSCKDSGHEGQLDDGSNTERALVCPTREDLGEVVHARRDHYTHVIIQQTVVPHACKAELLRGLFQVILPIFPKCQPSMPRSERLLPVVCKRLGRSSGGGVNRNLRVKG